MIEKENKEITNQDFEIMGEALSIMFRSFGGYWIKMGEVEKRTNINFNDFSKVFTNKDFVDNLMNKTPPAVVGLFVKILFKMSALRSLDLNKMSPDEKIENGKMMMELAKDIDDLIDYVKKARMEEKK